MGRKDKRVMKSVEFSLTGPKGIGITRHNIGGEAGEYRFTYRSIAESGVTFDKLVGVVRHGRFTWVHPSFSA